VAAEAGCWGPGRGLGGGSSWSRQGSRGSRPLCRAGPHSWRGLLEPEAGLPGPASLPAQRSRARLRGGGPGGPGGPGGWKRQGGFGRSIGPDTAYQRNGVGDRLYSIREELRAGRQGCRRVPGPCTGAAQHRKQGRRPGRDPDWLPGLPRGPGAPAYWHHYRGIHSDSFLKQRQLLDTATAS
jgi:hypothetical protein